MKPNHAKIAAMAADVAVLVVVAVAVAATAAIAVVAAATVAAAAVAAIASHAGNPVLQSLLGSAANDLLRSPDAPNFTNICGFRIRLKYRSRGVYEFFSTGPCAR